MDELLDRGNFAVTVDRERHLGRYGQRTELAASQELGDFDDSCMTTSASPEATAMTREPACIRNVPERNAGGRLEELRRKIARAADPAEERTVAPAWLSSLQPDRRPI